MKNKANWIKVNTKLFVSEEKAANGKPAFKLQKDAFGHYWRLLVWDAADNRYRYSQYLCYKLPEIKKFFEVCNLEKVGRYLEEIGQ